MLCDEGLKVRFPRIHNLHGVAFFSELAADPLRIKHDAFLLFHYYLN